MTRTNETTMATQIRTGLAMLRKNITHLRKEAAGLHKSLAGTYLKDADDLEAIAGTIACGGEATAMARSLDTAVRDCIPHELFVACGLEPMRPRPGIVYRAAIQRTVHGEAAMRNVLRDNLSPQAVAALAAYLQAARVKVPSVQREIEWFYKQLVETVGGERRFGQLIEEVGL